MSHWQVHGATHPGCVRERNEDAYGIEQDASDQSCWLVVCDGMGGHSAGDVASHTALSAILTSVQADHDRERPFASIYRALQVAHDAVMASAQGSDMGTTAVVAWCQGAQCWFGWVGDSRLYHIRDSTVLEKSLDHTVVNEAVARGELTEAQAASHPSSHMLSRALGAGGASYTPTVYGSPLAVESGDCVLLCSDGLYDMVADHEIAQIASASPPDEAIAALISLAIERGAHDNVTVAMAVYGANPARASHEPARATQEELELPEPEADDPQERASDNDEATAPHAPSVTRDLGSSVPPAETPPTTRAAGTKAPSEPRSTPLAGWSRHAPAFLAGLILGIALGWWMATPP